MSAKALMFQHVKENNALEREERAQWNQLIADQEKALMNSDDTTNIAARFKKERDEHNQFYSKAKADMVQKQQQDLEAFKQEKKQQRSDKGMER